MTYKCTDIFGLLCSHLQNFTSRHRRPSTPPNLLEEFLPPGYISLEILVPWVETRRQEKSLTFPPLLGWRILFTWPSGMANTRPQPYKLDSSKQRFGGIPLPQERWKVTHTGSSSLFQKFLVNKNISTPKSNIIAKAIMVFFQKKNSLPQAYKSVLDSLLKWGHFIIILCCFFRFVDIK